MVKKRKNKYDDTLLIRLIHRASPVLLYPHVPAVDNGIPIS